ncbi:low molecular weight protein-tyrosine-phosphatase [Paenibacillus sp. J22TS3]|uniref:low molecular weight protein-tyrosine-phosphatase n=1 Tax=Paenibacillus sp. J22TS3 TaxID=2807192 RepID=UPI001B00E7B7|nr:low molecular weight protein-tyrosine-phosphatase [Paenibacillus sp. J22TS3]GIP21838.1 phosphotyrosine protein phosphatase [Paenibacillus sp. J22TS3]
MIKVLFVCLGNICRSPMAEAMFRDLVKKEGLEAKFEIDSAATGDWHIGKPPHKGTLGILDKYRISSDGLLGRQITSGDIESFDYIIGMDESNISNILAVSDGQGAEKTFRLLDFREDLAKKDVPDPYYTGDFEETYDLLSKGLASLLEHIKKQHNLG